MPNGSGRLSKNLHFELKFHPKQVPKLVTKRDAFRNPLFSRFFARGTVWSHLKTTSSANFRKNGPPFWEPFWLKIRKNGATVISPFGSLARSPSVLRFWVPPPPPRRPSCPQVAWFLEALGMVSGRVLVSISEFYCVSYGAWFADGLVGCRASRIE